MTLQEWQAQIARTYGDRDRARGAEKTCLWLVEEVGELAGVIKEASADPEALMKEFSDVFAWLLSLANVVGVDLEQAAERYRLGCPKCLQTPCQCRQR